MSATSHDTALSDRDAQIVAAMRRAIHSMEVVDGLTIHFQDMTGHLSFGYDIGRLRAALVLLGADPTVRENLPEVPANDHAEGMADAWAGQPPPSGRTGPGRGKPIWSQWLSRLVGS